MGKEVERKFLVRCDSFRNEAQCNVRIKQGYFSISTADCTIRIRITNEQAWITIKSASTHHGVIRNEWEYPIPLNDAEAMFKTLPLNAVIEKVRYYVPYCGRMWEVDCFEGSLQPLIVAEIELNHEHETFEKPHWLGEEVTGMAEYYNAVLASHGIPKHYIETNK